MLAACTLEKQQLWYYYRQYIAHPYLYMKQEQDFIINVGFNQKSYQSIINCSICLIHSINLIQVVLVVSTFNIFISCNAKAVHLLQTLLLRFVLIQISLALCELSSVWSCPGAEGAGEGWAQRGSPFQAGSAVWLGSGETRQLSPKDRQGHQNTAAAHLPWHLQNRCLSLCLMIFPGSISIYKSLPVLHVILYL